MFSRTPEGLSNQALFYGVDFVVDTESVTRGHKPTSIDERFWRTIISTFRPTLKIKIKSAGAKSDLTPIAKMVAEGQIDQVVVCLDRDFDIFFGKQIAHVRVLYTFGYSWENDIIDMELLLGILDDICTLDVMGTKIEQKFRAQIRSAAAVGNRIGKYDAILQYQDRPLQNKEKYGELIDISIPGSCRFCAKRIRRKLATVLSKGPNLSAIDILRFDFFRHYHGKTVLFFLYHLIVNLAKECGSASNITTDLIINKLVKNFSREIGSNRGDMTEYYSKACAAII